MTTDEVRFYLRHRRQISEWASLEKRVDALMRDAVKEGAVDKALNLWKGESGITDADFYVRNRSLITQWDGLQTVAGEALHEALLAAGRRAGAEAGSRKRGHSSVTFNTEHLDGSLWENHGVVVQIWWIKQHLLSPRRTYPLPRLFVGVNRHIWKGETGDPLAEATRATAHELGMTKKDRWWVHWCMLDAIGESQDVEEYANACVARLQEASVRLYPLLADAIAATGVPPDPGSSTAITA